MDQSFTVTLIRHLPTKGNVNKKYIGWTDEPVISDLKTVRKVGGAREVFGSDLMRCQQTASILFGDTPYIENAKLRECSFGIWEEKTYEELKHDTRYQAWLEDYEHIAPPEGESLSQLEVRVKAGFKEVVTCSDHPIIVTHGGPIRALLSRFADSSKKFWEWDVPHGSMYIMRWKDRQEVLEGKYCTSYSVEHLMEKELL
ncbi:MAG: histidine phosphatase family protein [Psychrobacillus sp.]